MSIMEERRLANRIIMLLAGLSEDSIRQIRAGTKTRPTLIDSTRLHEALEEVEMLHPGRIDEVLDRWYRS